MSTQTNSPALFDVQLFQFDGTVKNSSMTFRQAAEMVRDNEMASVVVNVVSEDEIMEWWDDPGFPPSLRKHDYHKALSATGVTMGQLQRATGVDLLRTAAEYFGHASKVNAGMRKTRFIQLFVEQLGATGLTMGDWSEFLLATKREYPPFEGDPYSFMPHVDCIDFGRDTQNWSINLGLEQLGAFMTIQKSENNAGIVLWPAKPESRAQLDEWQREYNTTKSLQRIENLQALTIRPKTGQLCLFNSRNLHAVERCSSQRFTIGTFLICAQDGWKLLH